MEAIETHQTKNFRNILEFVYFVFKNPMTAQFMATVICLKKKSVQVYGNKLERTLLIGITCQLEPINLWCSERKKNCSILDGICNFSSRGKETK